MIVLALEYSISKEKNRPKGIFFVDPALINLDKRIASPNYYSAMRRCIFPACPRQPRSLKKLLIPHNTQKNTHWTLLVVDITSKIVFAYCPLGKSLKQTEFSPYLPILQTAFPEQLENLGNFSDYNFVNAEMPNQGNDYNCGPFVILAMKLIREEISVSAESFIEDQATDLRSGLLQLAEKFFTEGAKYKPPKAILPNPLIFQNADKTVCFANSAFQLLLCILSKKKPQLLASRYNEIECGITELTSLMFSKETNLILDLKLYFPCIIEFIEEQNSKSVAIGVHLDAMEFMYVLLKRSPQLMRLFSMETVISCKACGRLKNNHTESIHSIDLQKKSIKDHYRQITIQDMFCDYLSNQYALCDRKVCQEKKCDKEVEPQKSITIGKYPDYTLLQILRFKEDIDRNGNIQYDTEPVKLSRTLKYGEKMYSLESFICCFPNGPENFGYVTFSSYKDMWYQCNESENKPFSWNDLPLIDCPYILCYKIDNKS